MLTFGTHTSCKSGSRSIWYHSHPPFQLKICSALTISRCRLVAVRSRYHQVVDSSPARFLVVDVRSSDNRRRYRGALATARLTMPVARRYLLPLPTTYSVGMPRRYFSLLRSLMSPPAVPAERVSRGFDQRREQVSTARRPHRSLGATLTPKYGADSENEPFSAASKSAAADASS